MNKKLIYIALFIVLFAAGYFIAVKIDNEPTTVKRTQVHLGTLVEIQVRTFDEEKADAAISKAFEEIKRIDDLFTTYRSSGEVYAINKNTDTLIAVGDEVYALMKLSDSLWSISNGAFDLSLESLTRAWGFDTDEPAVPSMDSLKKAMYSSGWGNVFLMGENTISRKNEAAFNFGAIAKGYAVDRAVKVLSEAGVKEALVNAGGEIKALGNNWIIGIQHPRDPRALLLRIKLNGKSAATSGDYEKYFEAGGVRYHHILNPVTGYPAEGLQSVTVLAENDTWADAVSTAIFVLGPVEGLRFAESLEETEALLVDSEGKLIETSGFNKFIIKE